MTVSIYSSTAGHGPINVAFLHGIFGQGKNFTFIANRLGDLATSRMIDLPNHGRSAWTTTFDQDDMVECIASHLIDHGGLSEPVSLIGHSLGGKIAMRLALAYPRLVERLIVVDISPVNASTADHFEPWVNALLNLDLKTLGSRLDADRFLTPFIPDERIRSFLLTNLRRKNQTWSWRANLELLGESLTLVSDWPEPKRSQYFGPVLWIAGAESPYIKDEHLEAMQNLFPHTALTTVESAGHWVHADQPERFAQLVRDFLSKPLPH